MMRRFVPQRWKRKMFRRKPGAGPRPCAGLLLYGAVVMSVVETCDRVPGVLGPVRTEIVQSRIWW